MAPVGSTESSSNEGHFSGQGDCGFKSHSAVYLMNKFKIVMCPRKQPHDWSCCIFKHPKERAARRSLQQHNYEAVMCSTMLHKGSCDKGDNCPMAHSVFEYHMHPDKFRTKQCTEGADCKRNFCFFAHSEAELRTVNKQPKQQQQQLLAKIHPTIPIAANGVVYTSAAAGGQLPCSSINSGAVFKRQNVTMLAAPALPVQQYKSTAHNSTCCPTAAAQDMQLDINAATPAAAIASPFALQSATPAIVPLACSSTIATPATPAEQVAANAMQLQLHQLQQQQLRAATQLQLEMQAATAAEAAAAAVMAAAAAAPPPPAAAAAASMFQSAAASPMLQLSPAGSLFSEFSPMLSPYGSSSIGAADLPNLGFGSNSSSSTASLNTSPMVHLHQQQQQLPQSTFTPADASYLQLLLAGSTSSTSTALPLAAFNNSSSATKALGQGQNIGGGMTTPAFCLSSSSSSFNQSPCMPPCGLNTPLAQAPGLLGACRAPDADNALLLNGNNSSSSSSIRNGVGMLPSANHMAAVTDATQLLQHLLVGNVGEGLRF